MIADRDKFITDNLGLVRSCVSRYVGRGIEYDDLYQAACLGLVKAAGGFDETRGFKFSTYAVPVILGELRSLFRKDGTVTVSRGLKELGMRAAREEEAFCKTHSRKPQLSELAEALGVSPQEAAQAICASQPVQSLTIDDEGELTELPLTQESFDQSLLERLSLYQAIDTLDERDRNIIIYRYIKQNTQSGTAAALGMTQVQVSRREKKILSLLRSKMD